MRVGGDVGGVNARVARQRLREKIGGTTKAGAFVLLGRKRFIYEEDYNARERRAREQHPEGL